MHAFSSLCLSLSLLILIFLVKANFNRLSTNSFQLTEIFNAILLSKLRWGDRTWWQDTAFPTFTITNVKCTFTIICNVFVWQIIKDYRQIPFNWPKMFNAILFSKFRCGGRTWWQDTAFLSFTITNIKCTFTIICNVFVWQIIKDYRQIPFNWPTLFNVILLSKLRWGDRTWWQDTTFPSFTITHI